MCLTKILRILSGVRWPYFTGGWFLSSMVIMGSALQSPAQPDVVTMTSWMLALLISSRSASMMSRAPAAMPQVPMWTVTRARPSLSRMVIRDLVFSRIFARSWMRSLVLPAIRGVSFPSRGFRFLVLVQDRPDLPDRGVTVVLAVHDDDRADGAAAEAGDRLERELS